MKTRKEVKRTVTDTEILGRELTKKLCEQRGWEFQDGENLDSVYDCFITENGLRCMGEIKVRDAKFLRKPTMFLEVKKYRGLVAAARNESTDKIFYINWFGNVCLIFNITEKLIKDTPIELSLSNKVTAKSRDVKDKVYKEMYPLPKWKAERYILGNYDKIYKEIVEKFNLNL